MKEIKSFTIDRNIWLRGEEEGSCLYRENDGKMCCLGIYLSRCGLSRESLSEVGSPNSVADNVPNWLIKAHPNGRTSNSTLTSELIAVNDRTGDESEIKRLFKEAGITVRFKN